MALFCDHVIWRIPIWNNPIHFFFWQRQSLDSILFRKELVSTSPQCQKQQQSEHDSDGSKWCAVSIRYIPLDFQRRVYRRSNSEEQKRLKQGLFQAWHRPLWNVSVRMECVSKSWCEEMIMFASTVDGLGHSDKVTSNPGSITTSQQNHN